MGKHLWRKQSYVRVEKEDPGCIWTVFRMVNYHPWHNVKKMLPYINQKHHKGSSKMENEQIEFSDSQEFEEDEMTNYSASVNSSPSRNGSGSIKRSIKKRIKALLLADKNKSSGKVNTIQEHELLALKEACNDLGAPTLISFLNSNPKLLTTLNPKDESINLNRATSVKHKDSKEDYVGVLELFKVDQDLFLKILQDSPPKKHRLTKSGSFPFFNPPSQHLSTFGRTPSKLEHKHNEIWPIATQGHELRKAKSHSIARSLSLKESLDKYGPLIDANSNNNKGLINKHLSKSVKLTNEKDFGPLSDLHGRKSFRERMYLPEVESEAPRASLDCFLKDFGPLSDQHGRKSFRERMFLSEADSEAPRASLDCILNNTSQVDQVRVLRLESPPRVEIIGRDSAVNSADSNDDLKSISSVGVEKSESIQQVDIVEIMDDYNSVRNEGFSFVSEIDVNFQQDQIESVYWPILEDSPTVSHTTSTYETGDDVQCPEPLSIFIGKYETDYCNESLQYVKYVLDIIGFTTTIDQLESWHSPDQPLDSALFDGIEICCPFEPKPSSKKETTISNSQRKILFDLINEAIFDIHENSYAYYPKALTYGCVVHPEPKGKSRVVEQVWEFVRECLKWQPEHDVELNLAMARDLNRRKTGWSNLQTDIELLGIDLEDWIFDDLLDEICC